MCAGKVSHEAGSDCEWHCGSIDTAAVHGGNVPVICLYLVALEFSCTQPLEPDLG